MFGVIAYFTDVEGQWDKLVSYTDGNPHVSLVDGALRLADGVELVFGGDAIDRGPGGRRIVELLLRAVADYGERVVLLAGNRDINKLRLVDELAGAPPDGAPRGVARGELLQWIFRATMGAPRAFAHRASELAAEGGRADDDAVVASFLADLAPGGALRRYLAACRLAYRAGATLFVHGGVSERNFGVVPGRPRERAVDAWLAGLNAFYAGELAGFAAGRRPDALIAYQAPVPGAHENPESVVYSRLADDDGNPRLPSPELVARLRDDGIHRVVVGHTPSGDCPAIVRDAGFEVVLADNSYSRLERGSRVAVTDELTEIAGETVLDGGERRLVRYQGSRLAAGPLGRLDRATGQLVKARLATDEYLLFRGLPRREVEQRAAAASDVLARELVAAR